MSEVKVFESFEAAGIEGVDYRKTRQKLRCPKCSEARTDKRDKSLSVNVQQKFFKCHYGNCDFRGTIKGFQLIKKDFFRPDENKNLNKDISEKTLAYLKSRGFTDETISAFRVTSRYSKRIEQDVIEMPYFREKKLVNVKYRSLDKKTMYMVSDAELILYNLDRIDPDYPLIITEGEMDCWAFYQAGKYNVVSVPNGASSGEEQKLEYIENCWDYLIDVQTFILATDNDKAGENLKNALAKRLGKDKCKILTWPEGCKDANDVLLAYGEEKLREMVDAAKDFPIEGIISVISYLPQIMEWYDNGFPKGCDIGIPAFDEIFKFHHGQTTIWTGISNNGKSQALDHVMLRLALRHDWRFAVLSSENDPYDMYLLELAQAFAGKPFQRLSKEELKNIIVRFLDKHFIMLGLEDTTIPGILERAKYLKLRYGINSLVIDPWNTLTHQRVGKTSIEYIRDSLRQLILFCKQHDIYLNLVVHPRKINDLIDGKQRMPTGNDISDSGDFERMIDNIIVVHRMKGTREERKRQFPVQDSFFELGDSVVWKLDKIRKKYTGRTGQVEFDVQWKVPNYSVLDYNHFESLYEIWKQKQNGKPISLRETKDDLSYVPDIHPVFKAPEKPIEQKFPEVSQKDIISNFDYKNAAFELPDEEIDVPF